MSYRYRYFRWSWPRDFPTSSPRRYVLYDDGPQGYTSFDPTEGNSAVRESSHDKDGRCVEHKPPELGCCSM